MSVINKKREIKNNQFKEGVILNQRYSKVNLTNSNSNNNKLQLIKEENLFTINDLDLNFSIKINSFDGILNLKPKKTNLIDDYIEIIDDDNNKREELYIKIILYSSEFAICTSQCFLFSLNKKEKFQRWVINNINIIL
jgi:hypothetical protein